MNNYITLNQLATELSMDRSNARKYVLKNGFTFHRVRTAESRGQLSLALTLQDAQSIRNLRLTQGFGFVQHGAVPSENNGGHFYVVQIVPDLAPLRVKLGFTNDLEARMQSYRTSAPTATIVGHWPCKRAWESTAMASLTRIGCSTIGCEVFECDSIERLLDRAEAFFALMP